MQLDEPYLQANAEAARRFAVEAIDRALAGVAATTVLHTCYGYAVYVTDKRGGYPFLAELADCAADQLAIEFAQPRLDPAVLAPLAGKTIVLGVIDLSTNEVESADGRSRTGCAPRCEVVPPERLVAAPDCGMKFLPRAVAFAKLAALAEGAAHGARRGVLTSDSDHGPDRPAADQWMTATASISMRYSGAASAVTPTRVDAGGSPPVR